MPNNELTVVIADGSTKTLRDRDTGFGHAQVVDVAPMLPTVVAGAQYNLTISTAVITLTVPATATHAFLTNNGAAVKMTEDGSAPSAANGLQLADGFIGELACPAPLKFIRAAAVDAKVNVTYRRYV